MQVMESSKSQTRPLGGLPPSEPTILARAPLEVAVVEVRFVSDTADIDAAMAAAIRDALEPALELALPSILPASERSLEFDFSSDQPPRFDVKSRGWRLVSADEAVQVTIMPTVVILQVTRYQRWSDSVRGPLHSLMTTVLEQVRPTLVQRIGVRYVNRFSDPSCLTVADWRERIDKSLLGVLENKTFGTLVRGAQQVVEADLGDSCGALLRHGPHQVQGSHTVDYMLDTDVFDAQATTFDIGGIIEKAETLNRTAFSLFKGCLTPAYYRSLLEANDVG